MPLFEITRSFWPFRHIGRSRLVLFLVLSILASIGSFEVGSEVRRHAEAGSYDPSALLLLPLSIFKCIVKWESFHGGYAETRPLGFYELWMTTTNWCIFPLKNAPPPQKKGVPEPRAI